MYQISLQRMILNAKENGIQYPLSNLEYVLHKYAVKIVEDWKRSRRDEFEKTLETNLKAFHMYLNYAWAKRALFSYAYQLIPINFDSTWSKSNYV